jgi:hypothetical protein
MTDVLDQWHYFATPVYSNKKLEFLEDVRKASNDALKNIRKTSKMDEVYPVIHANISSDERALPFFEYVVNTAWNLLDGQGYAMQGLSTYFTEIWVQEHHKYSSMEYHQHNDSQLVAFYFLECPENPPTLSIYDPRPTKNMVNIPEKDASAVTMASSQLNFVPEAGTLMFTNSWLPHSFSRNTSVKPFKFVHMNIAVRPHVGEIEYPDTAEIV